MLGPLLNRKSDISVRNGNLLYKQLNLPVIEYARPGWVSAAAPMSGGYRCYNPSVFASLLVPVGT